MDKKEEVLKAIDDLFGDTSYSLEEALDNMMEIQDKVQDYISALREDIRNQEND